MDACRFHHDNIRVEKAKAIAKYRMLQRLTSLFRYLELFVFLILLSRFSGGMLSLVNHNIFKELAATLISPRFVFLLGNAIVIALFFMSGGFSTLNGDKSLDLYDEYVQKCQGQGRGSNSNSNSIISNQMMKSSDAYSYRYAHSKRKMKRCKSQNLEAVARRDEQHRELRRNLTEIPHRTSSSGSSSTAKRRVAGAYAEDEMSGDEFRRTVEAFIARQQRFLREEGEIPISSHLI
ncbi:uncharacterized protein LOC127252335 [Andrographis paniculata]|uniref:uncharacterized protein LOC127252335 n=1 Tax=Andrographis paniculata TaxID=175694 RepID=UPI0021E91276|nr:uncharacterized protein LOC127252335 [Andrographis paniculata]